MTNVILDTIPIITLVIYEFKYHYDTIPPIMPPPRHNSRLITNSDTVEWNPCFTIMVSTSMIIRYISPSKIPQINFFVFCTFPAKKPPKKQEITYTTLIPTKIAPCSQPNCCTKTASKNNKTAVITYMTSKIFPTLFMLSAKTFILPP